MSIQLFDVPKPPERNRNNSGSRTGLKRPAADLNQVRTGCFMEQKKEFIQCPFCHNDRIVKGMGTCTQCFAAIGYGIVPMWALSIVCGIASVAGIATFAISNANLVATFAVFFPILVGGCLALKGIYSDRVVFIRR